MSGTYAVIPAPQDRARCKTCLDEGWIEVSKKCTCGTDWPRDGHDVMCGFIPCPEGCDAAPP